MKTLIAIVISIMMIGTVRASGYMGNCDPDSLVEITVFGTVQAEEGGLQDQFFLEVNTMIYRLNFGPWWYQPSVGEATRPGDGSIVKIYGGLNPTNPGIIPVIVVYEIDDEFWRNPYEPFWNQFNDIYSSDPGTYLDGIACGWPDSGISIEIFVGVVLTDTTMIDYHYFMDTDYDGLPDYRLNFGPPWYEAPDSVALPIDGDTVSIEGAILHISTYPVIVVFVIDGTIWRDETGFGPGHFGQWMHGNHNTSLTVWSPFDTLSQIRFQNGWNHDDMPGSMYCQMLELYHQNMFTHLDQKAFAGFEMGFFNQNRENLMHDTQYSHRMVFSNQFNLQFHYTQAQMDRYRVQNHERIRLFYWDYQTGLWAEKMDIIVDTERHIVSLTADTLNPFYILTADASTRAADVKRTADIYATVRPNPTAQGVTLEFSTESAEPVRVALLTSLWCSSLRYPFFCAVVKIPIPSGFVR